MDANLNTLVGREVAGFRLTACLGEGGMAMVFRGENVLDPSIVRAIKVVFPHLSAQPEFVKRFSLEARVLDQLQHPNIVRFYGLRQAHVDNSVLLVMELEMLDGDALSAFVAPNLGITEAVEVVRRASEGVAAAHAMGVVHRDIKPDNLLVTKNGQVKVLDFGIARAMDELQRKTQVTTAGVVPGTPGYMAPEVCNGALPTTAADVYALGLTLYELLIGRHPFVEPGQPPQSGLQMMFAHVQRVLPPLRSYRPDAPEALEKILARATAKDPSQRFQDANALATALRLAPTTVPVRTSTPPRVQRSSHSTQAAATNFQLPKLGDAAVVALTPMAAVRTSAPPIAERVSPPAPPASTNFQLPKLGNAAAVALAPVTATPVQQDIGTPRLGRTQRQYGQVVPDNSTSAREQFGDPFASLAPTNQLPIQPPSDDMEEGTKLKRLNPLYFVFAAFVACALVLGVVLKYSSRDSSWPSTEHRRVAPTRIMADHTVPAVEVSSCQTEMILIPAGWLHRGSPPGDGSENERPQNAVFVPAFCLDATEVTVERYSGCGTCSPPFPASQHCTGNGWRSPNGWRTAVNCVNWYQADEFCRRNGKRLPTETEWEYGARGSDDRIYPWGSYLRRAALNAEGTWASDIFDGVGPVGWFPDGRSPFGVWDMAGNVSEWTATPFVSYESGPFHEPSGRGDSARSHVIRGGCAFESGPQAFRIARRTGDSPTSASDSVGFRCAR